MWLPRWIRSRRDRSPTAPTAPETGRRGERQAVKALRRAGYEILARNVRTPCAEVDVLAFERGHLVVVEVKATAREDGPSPASRLRGRQRRRLEAAGRWLARRTVGQRLPVRHDLVTVTLGRGPPRVAIHRGHFGGHRLS